MELTERTPLEDGAPPQLRGGAAHVLLRDTALSVGVLLLLALVGLALLGPALWRTDPNALDLLATLQPPSADHPMGTDSVGRDIFARFLRGAQISLSIGFIVILAGSVCGGTIGLLAGSLGGWVDVVLMRVMDAILAFPSIVLAMAVTVGLGAGIKAAALGITISSVPWYARVLRSEVLRVRALPFVDAASALGATRTRLVVRHVVPHVVPTLFIQAAAAFGFAILALAGLGFIGLGAQIPTPEWGAMITDGLQYALTGQWWVGVFPGVGVLVAVTAANLIADRARDILDPRGQYARV